MEIHTKDTAYSVVVFEDGELQLDVALNPRENTV